jgi:2-keto-4-pentenoate hydratase/2-oxohepta-3-ene-1,7-dioic acid hydratase in catechol pathway
MRNIALNFSAHNLTFAPNRIFCISKNYGEHIKELGGTHAPEEPVVFMKPVCNIVAPGETLHRPSFGRELHHEVEVVLLIAKEGKNISAANALSHISAITLGLDLTLRDVQKKLKKAGLPWELSKSFEQSAPLGIFKNFDTDKIDSTDLPFSCSVNGNLRQKGNTHEMIFPIANLIQILSGWWTLRPGDIIFTGTPAGVASLHSGDKIEIESPMIGAFSWSIA